MLTTSQTTLSHRQRRKQRKIPTLQSLPADVASESPALGFDGGGDARRLQRKNRNAMNNRSSKRRGASPFDTGATSDDNHRRKNNGAFDRKNKGIVSNGGNEFRSKKFGPNSRTGNASAPYEIDEDAYPVHSDTPGAMVIWNHLRDNGIFPPKWPDISDKEAMGRLRTDRDAWTRRALESLARANLVEGAESGPRKLSDIIHFRGICEDFCPAAEMIMRIIEPDIPSVEKNAEGNPDRRIMMKKGQRSAAGMNRPAPWDVRSAATIRRGVDYLIDDLLRSDENLPRVHTYIWDRTRELRRDFAYFTTFDNDQELHDQIYVFENCVRFHVTALHLLSRKDANAEGFVEQQEMEQLSKSLISLMDSYALCGSKGVVCENEAEFRAYHGLFFARSPDIGEKMQSHPKALEIWSKNDIYRTAVSLMELVQDTVMYHDPMTKKKTPNHAAAGMPSAFFRIVEDPSTSYTLACFAEIYFGEIRLAILRQLRQGFRRPKQVLAKDTTPALFNSYLRFDTDEEAVEFIEDHGLKFLPHPDAPQDPSRRYLDVRNKIEEPRMHHAFSQSLVERKRGDHSLPYVIHNTVYEGSVPPPSDKGLGGAGNFSSRPGLTSKSQTPALAPSESTLNSSAPFSGTLKQPVAAWPANPFGSAPPAKVDSPFKGFGAPSQPAPTAANPFASSTPDTTATVQNPFSSIPAATPSTFTADPPSANPFGGAAPPSKGATQDDATRSTSPFTSTTPGAPPFGQTEKADRPNPFSNTPSTVSQQQQQQPAQAQAAKNAFSAAPFGAPPVPKNASPFAGFTTKPSQTTTKVPEPAGNLKADEKPTFASAAPAAPGASPFPNPFAKASEPSQPPSKAAVEQPASAPSAFPSQGAPSVAPAASPMFSFSATKGNVVAPGGVPATKAPTTATTTTTAAVPSLKLPPPSETQQPEIPPSSILGSTLTQTKGFTQTELPKPAAPAPSVPPPVAKEPVPPPMPPPPAPKQDLLGDFTRWFVQGDGGLLEEFQDFIITDLVQKTYDQFQIDEAERLRREEEEADLKKAREFQIYNLRVKFFYRWRNIARTLRLRRRRENDKREYREYMAAKHAADVAAKEKAKRAAAKAAKAAALDLAHKQDVVDEFKDFIQTKRDNAAQYEQVLLDSGILAGVEDEQRAASSIVRGDFKVPRIPKHRSSRQSLPNGSSAQAQSPTPTAEGAKTRALREQLAGLGSGSFRRSLPPNSTPSSSWRASASPSEQQKRASRVSDRWRLKAMGLVTMPDGTALPEKIANSMRYDGVRYEGWGSFGLDGTGHKRSRSTSADLNHSAAVRTAFVDSFRRSGGATKPGTSDPFSPPNTKRKRTVEDEAVKNGIRTKKQATTEDSIEKILREARELRGSLRSSRMDLDETTGWFKEQSDMMQQDEMLSGRSSSAWGEE